MTRAKWHCFWSWWSFKQKTLQIANSELRHTEQALCFFSNYSRTSIIFINFPWLDYSVHSKCMLNKFGKSKWICLEEMLGFFLKSLVVFVEESLQHFLQTCENSWGRFHKNSHDLIVFFQWLISSQKRQSGGDNNRQCKWLWCRMSYNTTMTNLLLLHFGISLFFTDK